MAQYESYIYSYISTVNPAILMMDYYPMYQDGWETSGRNELFYCHHIIAKKAAENHIDYLPVIPLLKKYSPLTANSVAEMRYHIYAALLFGAHGFSYWGREASSRYDPPGDDVWDNSSIVSDSFKNHFRDLHALIQKNKAVLDSLEYSKSYHISKTCTIDEPPVGSFDESIPDSCMWSNSSGTVRAKFASSNTFIADAGFSTTNLAISFLKHRNGNKDYFWLFNKNVTNGMDFTVNFSGNTNVKDVFYKQASLEIQSIHVHLEPGQGKLFQFDFWDSNDITIASGDTLTITDNSTAKFNSGKKITINGVLILKSGAKITKVSGGGNLSGIDIAGSGKMKLDGNATIEYASIGVEFLSSSGQMDNSTYKLTIKDCSTNAIYVSNYSPTIKNVLMQNIGSVSSYAGIEMNGSSAAPTIEHVTIESSKIGLNLFGSSHATLKHSNIENTNSSHSIYMSQNTGITLNSEANNICPLSGKKAIYMYNSSCDTVFAQGNYWGINPPADSLFSYPTKVKYNNYATSRISGIGAPAKIASNIVINDRFKEASDFEMDNDWENALSIYNDIIDNSIITGEKLKSIKFILRVKDHSDRDYSDLRNIIKNELLTAKSRYKAELDFILCDILIREGKYKEAINVFSEKANQYKDTSMEVEILGRIANIYGDYLNDKVNAKGFADKAAAINPGQNIVKAAYSSAGIEYDPFQYDNIYLGKDQNLDSEPAPQKSAVEEVKELVTISPNPFNPVTTITYSITKPGHVSLYVYNITGQKVATLVNSSMPAGKHIASFDGSNLASGIYFYRFESPGFAKTGKMMLVK